MDLICGKCGEPWDNDCIHDEVAERNDIGEPADYRSVLAEFRSKGCEAFRVAYQQIPCKPSNSFRAMAADALWDVMGDDADGHASMMEDAEYFGWLK